ncbi:MAG TPA: outer membrane protein transport protein [Kofleriaceae bacterium]|jgi:long-chain fatty acid transport protein|nr:outer membrane protein transport protein [Kofleriaceae bacterium]
MRKLIITTTILVPTAAFAGGYLVPSVNPRDLALGGVAVADQNGPEATFLNAADLASQEGLAIGVAGAVANNRTDWSDSTLGSASVSANSTPPAVAISYGEKLPFDQAWGVGIGFGVPGGGTLNWPDNWVGQEAVRSVKTQVFGIGAGAAFQLLPYFRFGINYTRYQATEEIHQALNFLDHVGDAGIGLSGGGNSIGVATEVVPPKVPIKLGITYQHSSTIGLTGHVHFSDVPAAFQPMLHDQPLSEDFLMPDVVRAGLAYEVMPGLRLMGAYSFEHWSQYQTDHFIGDGGFTAVVKRSYNNVHTVGVAGEWAHMAFLQPLTVRAGVTRNVGSDQPTETLSPSLTDASRWALSIGAGYDIMPQLRADVGFQHQILDSVTATGMDAFPGTYKTAIDFFSVGVTWRTELRPQVR